MRAVFAAWLLLGLLSLSACASIERHQLGRAAEATASPELRKVASASELDALLASAKRLSELEEAQAHRRNCRRPRSERVGWYRCPGDRRDDDESTVLESVEVTGSRLDPRDLITNNQEAGVDEGDFVKKSGDFLLVLRGGTLHVVRIARQGAAVLELATSLRLADDGDDEIWFDEILTFGSRVLLLGFNYGEVQPVAELQLFTLGADGSLARDGRFWLRSRDYFDGDNYGARLQGDNLLVTLQLPLELSERMVWPEWSRRDVPSPSWTPLLEAGDLYYPTLPGNRPALHVVMQCPLRGLDADRLDCRSTGFVATGDSEIYATPRHAYLAIGGLAQAAYEDAVMHPAETPVPVEAWPLVRSVILRVPFEAGPPVVASVHGEFDRAFQFREDPDGTLWVLPRAGRHDDEKGAERYVLFRLRPGDFSGFAGEPPPPVSVVEVPGFAPAIRFDADAVWFGEPAWWGGDETTSARAWVLGLRDGVLHDMVLGHSVEVLQPVQGRMLAIGQAGEGGLAASLLVASPQPSRLDVIRWPGHVPSEGRSHAVNVGRLPDGTTLLGVPAWPAAALDHDVWPEELASDLVYARIGADRLDKAGELSMQDPGGRACEDCWDWYGNSRTFFIGARVFALSGSLLTEAAWRDGRVAPVKSLALP